MYSAHTLTQPAHTGHVLRPGRPCRGRVVGLCAAHRVAHRIVVQGAVSLASSIVSWRLLDRVVVPTRSLARRVASLLASYRGSLLRCIAAQCCHTRPKVAPSATIQIFVLRPCSQPRALRAVSRVLPAVSQAAWLYHGRAVAVSWPTTSCRGAPLGAASQPCLS